MLLLLQPLSIKADALSMSLVNLANEEEALSNHIGKGNWVVINTWSPTCSACVAELPQIRKFIERNPDIFMLGITLDFPSFGYGKMDILQEFLKTEPLDYPLFLADIEQASEVIGRWLVGIPSMTIFHPDGRPLVTWPGVVEIDEIEKYITNYKVENDPLSDGFD
ncbi:MAG: redoxin domain-containing protein [Proteobacteria bacterium]|nr:redoxin domain-containing protein [Pseudomonadota bacterium]